MSVLAAVVGLVAAVLLLAAGYLFGARRGKEARVELSRLAGQREDELTRLRAQASSAGDVEQLQQKLSPLLEPLLRQGEAVQTLQSQLRELSGALEAREDEREVLKTRLEGLLSENQSRTSDAATLRADMEKMLAPLLQRGREDQRLRSTVKELLEPLMKRQKLDVDLSSIETSAGRDALPRLLDGIAAKGFKTVLLSDDSGLPLAANRDAEGLDRLAGISSILLLLADRMKRDGAPAPLATIVFDESNHVALHRLFRVAGQRLLLSAVSPGAVDLSPTALDPTLAKIEAVLASAKRNVRAVR